MLVDDLLLSVADQHHHVGVKGGDHTPELEAVDEKNGDPGGGAAKGGEKTVLNIGLFAHGDCGETHGYALLFFFGPGWARP